MKQNPYAKMQNENIINKENEDLLTQLIQEAHESEEVEAPILANEEKCKELICPNCNIKQEAEEIRLRSLAEMDNFKKRMQRDQEDFRKYAAETILSDLLPSLDNLDLALQYGSKNEACKDIIIGVEMTKKLLLDAVKNHGLEMIGVVGESFNPEIHEAIGYEEKGDIPPDHVYEVMQKGYKLKERLLRPAKVMVSKSPTAPTARLNVKI